MDKAADTDDVIDFASLMRAMEAAAVLAPVLGGTTAAKSELADRMRDGRLAAYATRAWNSTKRNVLLAWREEPDPDQARYDVEYDLDVEAWVWRSSEQWAEDQSTWRWPSGRFSVVHRANNRTTRVMVEDVHFDPVQIAGIHAELGPLGSADLHDLPTKDIQDGQGAEPSEARAKSANRHTRGETWAFIALELIRLLQTGEIYGDAYDTQKKLRDYLSTKTEGGDRVTKKPLQAETIEPLVKIVLPVLREGKQFLHIPDHQFKP